MALFYTPQLIYVSLRGIRQWLFGSFQKVIMRLSYVFCLWIIISQGWAQE